MEPTTIEITIKMPSKEAALLKLEEIKQAIEKGSDFGSDWPNDNEGYSFDVW